jgi:hypothetical protein
MHSFEHYIVDDKTLVSIAIQMIQCGWCNASKHVNNAGKGDSDDTSADVEQGIQMFPNLSVVAEPEHLRVQAPRALGTYVGGCCTMVGLMNIDKLSINTDGRIAILCLW